MLPFSPIHFPRLTQVLSLITLGVNLFTASSALALLPQSLLSPPPLMGTDLVQGNSVQMEWQDVKSGTVIVFLSVMCPCSNSHQQVLNSLAQEFKDHFRFVGIHSNANEPFSLAREHFKTSQLSFPVIQDNHSKIADQFKAFKTPHVFVVNPTGTILFQGGVDDSKIATKAKRHYLRDALALIRDGKPVLNTNVRVVGCEIKRPET